MGQAQFGGKGYQQAAQYGAIYVQLDKSHYYAGEQVTGKIGLMLKQQYPGFNVNLKLKGVEITYIRWIEVIHKHHPGVGEHPGRTEAIRKTRIERDSAVCLFQTVNIYTFPGGQHLSPGQYEFPFSFKLPANIPGTFHQYGYNIKADIGYTVEAFLEPSEKSVPKLKYKKKFIVREPVRNAIQTTTKATETAVSDCCCCDYGVVGIKASFERNSYCPGDQAQAIIQVDNSKCKKPIMSISLSLVQVLTVIARTKVETRVHTVAIKSIPGVEAGKVTEPLPNSIILPPAPDLNLVFLKGDQHLENIPMNVATMNSSTNGRLIKCHFYLEAKGNIDACCVLSPASSIPCHISYPDYRFPVVQPPPNWNPRVMDTFNFSTDTNSNSVPRKVMNTNLMPGEMMQGNIIGMQAVPQQTNYLNTKQNGYQGSEQNNDSIIQIKSSRIAPINYGS